MSSSLVDCGAVVAVAADGLDSAIVLEAVGVVEIGVVTVDFEMLVLLELFCCGGSVGV